MGGEMGPVIPPGEKISATKGIKQKQSCANLEQFVTVEHAHSTVRCTVLYSL